MSIIICSHDDRAANLANCTVAIIIINDELDKYQFWIKVDTDSIFALCVC